jgi:hypothetical protein
MYLSGDRPYRWNWPNDFQTPFTNQGEGFAYSRSGTYLVGWCRLSDPQWGSPFIQTGAGAPTSLGTSVPIPPASYIFSGEAHGVSDNGQTAVGWFNYIFTAGGGGDQAFYWKQATGIAPLPDLAGGPVNCAAYDLSPDGRYAVGFVQGTLPTGNVQKQAAVWDLGATTIAPVRLSSASVSESEARAISANGAFAVGYEKVQNTSTAVRWPTSGGVPFEVPMGTGAYTAIALGVSADGSVIVGQANLNAPSALGFIWDAAHGMRRLDDVVALQGAPLPCQITSATSISDDGRTVAANGPCGAWVIRLGGACGSHDFDGDGDAATDHDIEAFFACIAGNCCAACGTPDFNHDGDSSTDADIESFFRALAGQGC